MLKHYWTDYFEGILTGINFLNYEISNATTKIELMILLSKNLWLRMIKRVKDNSQKWFHGKVSEGIKNRDKLFRKFRKSRLYIDE